MSDLVTTTRGVSSILIVACSLLKFGREFTMAEIEHYVDPKDKRHARYAEVKDIVLNLLPKEVQEGGETTLSQMSIGDAVSKVSMACLPK